MQLLRNIPEVLPQPCVATIGFFDGVHRGHRYLIEQVREAVVACGFASGGGDFSGASAQSCAAGVSPRTTDYI